MTMQQQKTATCRCGKKVKLPPVGAGSIKHGCGRVIEHASGKVIAIKDKA